MYGTTRSPATIADARRVEGVATETWRIDLTGHVQGVGYRPFVYRLATELDLKGEVSNRDGAVRLIAEGDPDSLRDLRNRLIDDAPPLARPIIAGIRQIDSGLFHRFRIQVSKRGNEARVFVPPDNFMCADCAREFGDPDNRRYRYPFINCTQCGPRYTLITAMPYDRCNTSMAGFPLCDACHGEYSDPRDRRFHAEPVACADCGPHLEYRAGPAESALAGDQALLAAVADLRAGRIVAVKGIGGYHLVCDATSHAAVAKLRDRKQRPDKPLAVMFPAEGEDGMARLRRNVSLCAGEANAVSAATRPIVLAGALDGNELAPNVAPGLNEIGVFLPYSPLHDLLLGEFAAPLVATSGNISGEPVLTRRRQAAARLKHIADAFLHHDRPIVRPADDPVCRFVAGDILPIRIGRGNAPLEMSLPWRQAVPTLCLGGHMKATIALAWDERAVVSPHIGEMDSTRSLSVFEQAIADLQALYGIDAQRIVCDAHTGYTTHRWARRQKKLPLHVVYHHHAHASAVVAESGRSGPWLMFTWDGVGLGEDGELWGGEALLGDAGSWRRVCSLRRFRAPGGDRVGREPWRSAAALTWESGGIWRQADADVELVRTAWRKGLNSPYTSAAGRLFDAAAAIICGIRHVSYEAQGPMQLEALCRRARTPMPVPLRRSPDGVFRSDWEPLLDFIGDPGLDRTMRAEVFHSSMARMIADQARAIRGLHDVSQIGLCGGVFQNRILTEQAKDLLEAEGFDVHLSRVLPCNDACISLGQAAEIAARENAARTE